MNIERRQPRLHATVRLTAEGLAKVLGDLEARLLRAVWDMGRPVSGREVHGRIAGDHDVAPVTVITVLNKLVRKGLMRRHKRDGRFHYEPTLDERAFTEFASRWLVEGILSLEPRAVAASFVDVLAERDPDRLAELEALIRRRIGESREYAP